MIWSDLCFNRLTLAAVSKLGYKREGRGQSRKKIRRLLQLARQKMRADPYLEQDCGSVD